MEPSAAICRKQEEIHRKQAAATTLANVRLVAERAATAWANEALIAERREARRAAAATAATISADSEVPELPEPRTRTSWTAFSRRPTWHG